MTGRMTEARVQQIRKNLQTGEYDIGGTATAVMEQLLAHLDAQAQWIAELEWAFSHIVYLKTMKYPGKDRDWNESEIYRIAEKYAAKPQAQQADAALTGPKETP